MVVVIVCDCAFLAVIVQTAIVAAAAADIVRIVAGSSVVVDLGVFRDHHVQERAIRWNWLDHFNRLGKFYDLLERFLVVVVGLGPECGQLVKINEYRGNTGKTR
jgi:hypothetical protein